MYFCGEQFLQNLRTICLFFKARSGLIRLLLLHFASQVLRLLCKIVEQYFNQSNLHPNYIEIAAKLLIEAVFISANYCYAVPLREALSSTCKALGAKSPRTHYWNPENEFMLPICFLFQIFWCHQYGDLPIAFFHSDEQWIVQIAALFA